MVEYRHISSVNSFLGRDTGFGVFAFFALS